MQTEIQVGGSVDATMANAFAIVLARDVKTLSAGRDTITLDFRELELDDGSAVAETVNALRELLVQASLVVHNAPQMLAHTLYKCGMLEGARLVLKTPRIEEPTTT